MGVLGAVMATKISIADFAPRAHRSLTEFGYKVTLDFVTEEAQHLLMGHQPRGIIGLMMAEMLSQNDATLIYEKEAAP